MLTSELAEELQVDPSVITKMRKTYREEAALETAPPLKGEALQVLREAHALKLESKGMTYRQAIRRRLGLTTQPMTAEQVGVLEKRMAILEQAIARQDEKLDTLLEQIDSLTNSLRSNAEQKTDEALDSVSEVKPIIVLPTAAVQEEDTQLSNWAQELIPEGVLSGHEEAEEPENP
ncbi:hypothetical protein ACFFLM_24515 [Deinococcus oregonensis]|uniref:Uncharacterized protein n=1 Tax=Deinococcus oregonensis TaxID=1805970 RepID=A0ABV6B5S6_9DEIO